MKRHCFPLRGDHSLLTPDSRSGVSLREKVCSEYDESDVEKRCSSPTRRLRFEDETEMEAESRYLERKRVGWQGTTALMSKPELHFYLKGVVGLQHRGGRLLCDRQQQGRNRVNVVGHNDRFCFGAIGGKVNPKLQPVLNPSVAREKVWRRNSSPEPLRETHIGCLQSDDTFRGEAGPKHSPYMQVRRVEQNETQINMTNPITDLPLNPYASPPSHYPTCLTEMSQGGTVIKTNKKQKQDGLCNSTFTHKNVPSCSEQASCVKVEGSAATTRVFSRSSPTLSPLGGTPEFSKATVGFQCSRNPLRSQLIMKPQSTERKEEPSHLGNPVWCTSKPCSPSLDTSSPATRKSSNSLKKSSSVQSLSAGSPVLKLRKSLSIQSFHPELQKNNHPQDYRPAAGQSRCLCLEDISHPSSVRCVGRVLEVCSDGTVLVQLSRPIGETFGFTFTRGKLDSGMYVGSMEDCHVEKLYRGLLAVGDQIVEVNGEKVSRLSLDQVTQLLMQNSCPTIRVLRYC